MVVVTASKKTAAVMSAAGDRPHPKDLKRIERLLQSVLKHRPFTARSSEQHRKGMDCVARDVWKTRKPEFDVQGMLTMILAKTSTNDPFFRGWTKHMFHLRSCVAKELNYIEAGSDACQAQEKEATARGEGAAPVETARQNHEVSDMSIDTEDEDSAGTPHDQGPNSRTPSGLIPVRDFDPKYDDNLVRAVVELKPHCQADEAEAWMRVALTLKGHDYRGKTTAAALKKRFGRIVNLFARPAYRERYPGIHLMLVDYCKSTESHTSAMKNLVSSLTGAAMPHERRRVPSTRVMRIRDAPQAGERERRSARLVSAPATSHGDVESMATRENDQALLAMRMEVERNLHTELMALMGYRERCEKLGQ